MPGPGTLLGKDQRRTGFKGALNAVSQSSMCGAQARKHLAICLGNHGNGFHLLGLESEFLFCLCFGFTTFPASWAGVDTTPTSFTHMGSEIEARSITVLGRGVGHWPASFPG